MMGKQDILLITRLIRLFVFFVFLSLSPEKLKHLWEHEGNVPSVRATFLSQHRVGQHPFIVPLYHEGLYETHVDVHWKRDAKAGC